MRNNFDCGSFSTPLVCVRAVRIEEAPRKNNWNPTTNEQTLKESKNNNNNKKPKTSATATAAVAASHQQQIHNITKHIFVDEYVLCTTV